LVAGGPPGIPEPLDLFGLELVERHPGVLGEQRRAHQVHALLRGPLGGLAGSGAPPDPVAKPWRVRLYPEQAGRVREHRPRVGLREPFALDHLEEHPGVFTRHGRVVGALGRLVAEVAKPVDHLLR
jgi:hypothetical protein